MKGQDRRTAEEWVSLGVVRLFYWGSIRRLSKGWRGPSGERRRCDAELNKLSSRLDKLPCEFADRKVRTGEIAGANEQKMCKLADGSGAGVFSFSACNSTG